MDNRNDIGIFVYVWIAIFGVSVITASGFLGILFAFFIMTKYMHNFVLMPIAKKISAVNNTPYNYILGKLKTTRMIIWIIAAILNFSIIFVIEMIAIAISMSKINEIRAKLGLPKVSFSDDAYLIYEEYARFSEDDEYDRDEIEEDDNGDTYTRTRQYSYDNVINNQEVKVNVAEKYTAKKDHLFENKVTPKKVETVVKNETLEEKEEKLKKEIEAIKNEIYKATTSTTASTSTNTNASTSSIWDKPVETISSISNVNITDKKEANEDEICCEKCGATMSKMKIACPKCGALVKNNYGKRK